MALMIGVNDGGPNRIRLQYAATDAQNLARALEELGGVEKQDITLLAALDSTGMAKAMEDFSAKVSQAKHNQERIEVILFYSGHADEQGLLLRGQHYGFRQFRQQVEKIPAEVRIAIVDACASGALTQLKGGRRVPAFLADKSLQANGYAFLTSSSSNEAAQESDRIRASFFSHYLNTGLRGAADASQDGRITLHEAYDYAYKETLARTENSTGGPQHASYDMRISGSGDVVMTDLNRASASLAFSDAMEGRFFIRDIKGQLLAEVQKPNSRPLSFALEPGVYRIHWHLKRKIREITLQISTGGASQLNASSDWKNVDKEWAVARGPSPLRSVFGGESEWGAESESESQFEWWHNQISEDYRGTLFTVGINRAQKRFDGQQFSGFYNSNLGKMNGVQASMGFNYAREPLLGCQISGMANWAGENIRGLQFSGGFNYAHSMSQGIQYADLFNYVGGSAVGFQGSSVANMTKGSLYGAQMAFLYNYVGGDLHGAQLLGFLNLVPGTVDGYQFGLINIAHSYHQGAPLGILNFVGKGVWRGDFWMDETGFRYYGLVTGTRKANTRLAMGQNVSAGRNLGSLVVETLGHFSWQPTFVEMGLMAGLIGEDKGTDDILLPDFIFRPRFSYGIDLGHYVSVAAGVSWAFQLTPSDREAYVTGQWLHRKSFNHQLQTWPSAHISIRLGTYGESSP